MKFDAVMKQFKLNTLRVLLSKILFEKREITAVFQTASIDFNVGMQSNVYE